MTSKIYPFRVFINFTTYPTKFDVKFHKEVFVNIDQALERYALIQSRSLKYFNVAFTIHHPDLNPDQAWGYVIKAIENRAKRKL